MPRFDESHQASPPLVRLQVERPRFPQAGPFPSFVVSEGRSIRFPSGNCSVFAPICRLVALYKW